MNTTHETAIGVPAAELSDIELTEQGAQAHATRNWVFLHGTAAQFRHHTERMLELEQEYLRRFPKRTWQGSGGAGGGEAGLDLAGLDVLAQIRHLTRTYSAAVEALLGRRPGADAGGAGSGPAGGSGGTQLEAELLARYAATPAGRMHKLEAHQAAREVGIAAAAVAALFKAEPPLLVTAGEHRQITAAGRARLAQER